MKQIIFTLDKKHSMMSRQQASDIEKEFGIWLEYNIDTQVWELAIVK